MDPSSRLIISRAITVIVVLVVAIYGFGIFKKIQRQNRIVSELKLCTGESSFFQQFSEADAKKTLVRAMGLLAEADTLGMDATETMEKAIGINAKWFEEKVKKEDIPMAQQIIMGSLRKNYENFVKLGFTSDFQTIKSMKEGNLVPLSTGTYAGRTPIIKVLIPASISPGIEKVTANMIICPPDAVDAELTDIQIASAKQLARDLNSARLLEKEARDQILLALDKIREKPLANP